MPTRLLARLALASVAAVGLYVPTMGMPLPLKSCLHPLAVASAAPSAADEIACARDLRECLRNSARTTIYGARYVTADEVAICMEAFNACAHGGVSTRGNPVPPTSTAARNGGKKGLPQHLGITYDGALAIDCRVNGAAVNCTTIPPNPLAQGFDSWTGEFAGTLSGMTATGTKTIHIEGFVPGEPSCRFTQEGIGSATAVFNSDGTVTMREAPFHWQKTYRGSCSGDESNTIPAMEWTAPWSAIE